MRFRWNLPKVLGATCIVLPLAFLLLWCCPVSKVSCWVSETTGSTEYRSTTVYGWGGRTCEVSLLEAFLSRRCPGGFENRWVYLSTTKYNVFGLPLSFADSCTPAYEVAIWANSPEFKELSDDRKMAAYDLLAGAGSWPKDNKERLYSDLLRLKGKQLRDFIDHGGQPSQKKDEKSWTAGPSTERARELERLIDDLAFRNPPNADAQGGEYPKGYDLKEHERVKQAVWNLSQDDSNDLWGRLVEHAEDKRFSILAKYRDPDFEETLISRWTVGQVCKSLVWRKLRCVYLQHLEPRRTRAVGTTDRIDSDNVLPTHAQLCLNRPLQLLSDRDFAAWCAARKNKPLYEVQIELCECAIKDLEAGFPRPGMAREDIPEEPKRKFIAAVRKEIESLKKNKKPAVDHSPWASPLTEESLNRG
jgi:hypothetical protein